MRWPALFLLVMALFLGTAADAQNLPSSQRSRNITSLQRARLQRSLDLKGFVWGAPLYIRIFKTEKKLELWLKQDRGFNLFKTYSICTYGSCGLGPKLQQGDGRAPEGFYYIAPRQMNPFSRYHLSFNLGYPNRYDRSHGRTGSALMIHGGCVSIGCFAMTDQAMEEIYTMADAAFRYGQPFFRVHIFPFRMTQKNMQRHRASKWINFWHNLKAGYDWFDQHGNMPPNVIINRGQYRFEMADKQFNLKLTGLYIAIPPARIKIFAS